MAASNRRKGKKRKSSQRGKPKPRAQRESTLPPGEANRILDRLLLLEQVIPPEQVRQVLVDSGCLDSRKCKLTFEVTCWVILAMGILTDLPIRQIFKASRRLIPNDWDPDRSSLCKARQRLGVAPIRLLFERLVRPLATPDTPGAFYKGLRKVAIDGSVYSVPDTVANAAAFGYPKGGRGAGAFPQVRKLSLVEVGTHIEFALTLGPVEGKGAGEQSMVSQLLDRLASGMLLLCDRGFFSYKLWQAWILRGCEVLTRVKASMILEPIRELSDGSQLVKVYPCYRHRNRDEGGIVVRLIRYTHDDPKRVDCGVEHRLVTTLLDAEEHPARELILLYHERWEIELTYDEQKTHQNPWRVTKSVDLRSESPLGVIQEVYALSLGHFAVRSMMTSAAEAAGVDPDRLSFMGCVQVLRTRLPEFSSDPDKQESWLLALLAEMGRERLPARRNRINPRVVRVKMSKFKKKRPEHRGGGKLDRTFEQTILPWPAPQLATG